MTTPYNVKGLDACGDGTRDDETDAIVAHFRKKRRTGTTGGYPLHDCLRRHPKEDA